MKESRRAQVCPCSGSPGGLAACHIPQPRGHGGQPSVVCPARRSLPQNPGMPGAGGPGSHTPPWFTLVAAMSGHFMFSRGWR